MQEDALYISHFTDNTTLTNVGRLALYIYLTSLTTPHSPMQEDLPYISLHWQLHTHRCRKTCPIYIYIYIYISHFTNNSILNDVGSLALYLYISHFTDNSILTYVGRLAARSGTHVEDALLLLRSQCHDGQEAGPPLQHVVTRQVLRCGTCRHR